ncbi:MAG: NAD(P)-binding protein [Nitrospiria bacterium]
MSPATRYDVVVVGGGLAGAAVAALAAKRGRRVVLIEPRPEWGGSFPLHRFGDARVASGPPLVMGYERLGAADVYFESAGLSLALLIREGVSMKREPVQALWSTRRLLISGAPEEVIEDIRREYGVSEAAIRAMWEDLQSVSQMLTPASQPSPTAGDDGAWSRFRRLAATRSWIARFGALSPRAYAHAKGWPEALASYLESWAALVTQEGTPAGWMARVGLGLRGLVTLPEGRAGLCRLLVARCESSGGHLVRAPITAVGQGASAYVEAGGQRFEAGALIINSEHAPGHEPTTESGRTSTVAFAVPAALIPEAMARVLLHREEGDPSTIVRRRLEGSETHMVITVSCHEGAELRTSERYADILREIMPFAQEQLTDLGGVSAGATPDPIESKTWESSPRWRRRQWGWQVGRSPIWWVADRSSPWIGDAGEFQIVLALDRMLSSH